MNKKNIIPRLLFLCLAVFIASFLTSCDKPPHIPADLLEKLRKQDSAAMRTVNVALHYDPDQVTQGSAYRMLQVAQFAYRWCEYLHGEPWPVSNIELYLKSGLDHETYGRDWLDRLFDTDKAVIYDAYLGGGDDPGQARHTQNLYVITQVVHLYFQHANEDIPVLLRDGAVQWTLRALEPQLGWQFPVGQLYMVEDRFTCDNGVSPLETFVISLAPEYGFQPFTDGAGLISEIERVLQLEGGLYPLEAESFFLRYKEPVEDVNYLPVMENYATMSMDFTDYLINRFGARRFVQSQRDPARMLEILGVAGKRELTESYLNARFAEMGLERSPVKRRKWEVRTKPESYQGREEFLLGYIEHMDQDNLAMAEWQQFIARFATNPDVFFDFVTKFGGPDDFLFEGLTADDMLSMVTRMEQADPASPVVRSYAAFLRGQVASLNKDLPAVDVSLLALREMQDPDLIRQIDFLEDMKRIGMEYDLGMFLVENGLDEALEANPENFLYRFLSLYRGMFAENMSAESLDEAFDGLEELYTKGESSQSFKRMVLFFDAYFAMAFHDWDRAQDKLGLFEKKYGLPDELALTSTASILKRKVEFFQRNPNFPPGIVSMCFPM